MWEVLTVSCVEYVKDVGYVCYGICACAFVCGILCLSVGYCVCDMCACVCLCAWVY